MPSQEEIKAAAIAIREEFRGRADNSPIDDDGEDGFGSFMNVARIALEAAERVRKNPHES